MTTEFSKKQTKSQTVYTLESATSGGTSSGSIASVSSPMGMVRKRGDNLIAQEADKKAVVPSSKPRNFVAKNASTGGAGAHVDKKRAQKQGQEKHRKPFAEQDMSEEWSKKYKSSINCSNPKGFSQKAHCAGKTKEESMSIEPDPTGYQKDLLTTPKNTLVVDTPGDLDWYKLGQHYPTLSTDDPHEYGQGDTDMIIVPYDQKELSGLKQKLDRLKMKYKEIGGGHEHPEIHDMVEGLKDPKDNPCWKGYKPVGTKKKGGREVPNCVPKESVDQGSDKICPQCGMAGCKCAPGKCKCTPKPGFPKAYSMEETVKKGLYYNVNKRKAAGTSRPASNPKAPTDQAWKDAAKTAKKEGVGEDHEIQMASSELQSIAKNAVNLLDMVRRYSEREGLQAWQQSKITKAADYLNSVLQSISGQQHDILSVVENFKDGKNPGRKGLAKRSGVNTKASVSALRKTARHSTGEKQRMAHWLANMKSGRAKTEGLSWSALDDGLSMEDKMSIFEQYHTVDNLIGSTDHDDADIAKDKGVTKESHDAYSQRLQATLESTLAEKIAKNAPVDVYIKDFEKSNAPQFRGKSKEKRREMAIAASYAAKNPSKKK